MIALFFPHCANSFSYRARPWTHWLTIFANRACIILPWGVWRTLHRKVIERATFLQYRESRILISLIAAIGLLSYLMNGPITFNLSSLEYIPISKPWCLWDKFLSVSSSGNIEASGNRKRLRLYEDRLNVWGWLHVNDYSRGVWSSLARAVGRIIWWKLF